MAIIDLAQAEKIAREQAHEALELFMTDPSTDPLSGKVMEAENCWIFFRNKDIHVPPEGAMRGDWAYAVSKTGDFRQVYDLSDDPQKCADYLQFMSDYFSSQKT